MGVLSNIKLSREEYDYLVNKAHFFDYGSEAHIIRDGDYVMKLFRKNFGHELVNDDEIESIRENKHQKIKILHGMKTFDNEFRPLATYSYNGKFVGYKGKYLDLPNLGDISLNKEEKIHYLKLIRNKLALFHELGIVYGDVKFDNILIDTANRGKIIFVDIDNMKVLDHQIDMPNSFATDFLRKYGFVDKTLDSYMMNFLTIEQLINECFTYDYEDILNMLEVGFIPLEVDCKKNKKLIREMVYVTEKYSGQYLIDNL